MSDLASGFFLGSIFGAAFISIVVFGLMCLDWSLDRLLRRPPEPDDPDDPFHRGY